MSVETQRPVDESVVLPAGVRAAAAAAAALHGQVYGAPAAPLAQPDPPPTEPPQQPDPPLAPLAVLPVPVAPPEPPPPQQPSVPVPSRDELQNDSWAAKYNSMRGRWDQAERTIGELQQQLAEAGEELRRMTAVLQTHGQDPAKPQPGTLNPKDREDYGDELVDFVQRAATAAVQPEIDALKNENTRLKKVLASTSRTSVASVLDTEVPNWRQINKDPRFVSWLNLRDIYSGAVRRQMLDAASRAADAPRVAAFFKGFLAEATATGDTDLAPQPPPQPASAPARQAAVPLETLAAPGRARPASGDTPTTPAAKPFYTRALIAKNYDDHRRGLWAGRDDAWNALERDMIAAGPEGRVR